MMSMDLLKDLQPYFYCTDAANLEKIRATGEIRANIHNRNGEGIFLRSFPVFAKKRSQIIVEDSFGSETVVTETIETQEYAIPIYLTESEVSQLEEPDGSVVYCCKEPVIHLPSDTKVITKKGDRIPLNSSVSSSNNRTSYDRVNNLHSEEIWNRPIESALDLGLFDFIFITFIGILLKPAYGYDYGPERFYLTVVMLIFVLLYFILKMGILALANYIQQKTMPKIERQKAM